MRPITEGEVPEFQRVCVETFGGEVLEDDVARFVSTHPLDRTATAFEGATMVGTSADMPFDLTVPGGVLPLAGLTMVTVRPTHRRRGVMLSMIRAYTDQAHERGDPLGGLWAAEWPIYGRFGFGAAADKAAIAFDGPRLEIASDPAGPSLALLDTAAAREVLPEVYRRARVHRPGMLGRSDAWWEGRHFHDPPQWRHGASANRFVVASRAAMPTGYAVYRQKSEWDGGHSVGEVRVTEVIAVDGATEQALWQYLSRIDLFPRVSWNNAPTDTLLAWIATDNRRIERRIGDGLWLRLLDVVAALTGRRYRADGTLVLRVVDEYCPWNDGSYRLAVEQGAAECRRTDAEADLTLTAATLAALYLGGRSATVLADAGLVTGAAGAVTTADILFGWDRAPWCAEVF